jgi:hypothetical protein
LCILRIYRGEQLLGSMLRWRAECFVEVDRLSEFLADEFEALRQFLVAGQSLLDPIGVAAALETSECDFQATVPS